jgi:hypothetical protein
MNINGIIKKAYQYIDVDFETETTEYYAFIDEIEKCANETISEFGNCSSKLIYRKNEYDKIVFSKNISTLENIAGIIDLSFGILACLEYSAKKMIKILHACPCLRIQ